MILTRAIYVYLLYLFKFFLFGLLTSQVGIFLIFVLAEMLSRLVDLKTTIAFILVFSSILGLGVFVSLGRRKVGNDQKIKNSWLKNAENKLVWTLGLAFGLSMGVVGENIYGPLIGNISLTQFYILVLLPVVVEVLFFLRFERYKEQAGPEESYFIDDTEIKSEQEDLLGVSESAIGLAERIIHTGTTQRIIYGIDAPWGIGKSSFINICQQYWQTNYADKTIVYRFNPLQYEINSNLLEKFSDGLANAILSKENIPELKPLITNYAGILSSDKSVSIAGFSFSLSPRPLTLDEAFHGLESVLRSLSFKVIVVIDDLDRISFSEIKNILNLIKKCFALPNVIYLLCYDTENIEAFEKDTPSYEKISEFMEKFISVKVSLYISDKNLKGFLAKDLDKSLAKVLLAERVEIEGIISGLVNIIGDRLYPHYIQYIGDIRKIKRFLNIVLYLKLGKSDLSSMSINVRDLIHLILIYINYPNIFRAIYNSETGGKSGYFSIPENYLIEDKDKVENSEYYNEYVTELKKKNSKAVFLLNQVFSVDKLDRFNNDLDNKEVTSTYACFNGNRGDRNLERYLELIVNLSIPPRETQYKFYLQLVSRIAAGTSIRDIVYENPEFNVDRNETSHKNLWKAVVNSTDKFDPDVGEQLIEYLIDRIEAHSSLEFSPLEIGIRTTLVNTLLILLDRVGWRDDDDTNRNNTERNILEITNRIFGDGIYSDRGILKRLNRRENPSLGFYDLLIFRLYCHEGRGGSRFNLFRALSLDGESFYVHQSNSKYPTSIISMRRISQEIFRMFKQSYIEPKINIFDEIDKLSFRDVTGEYFRFLGERVEESPVLEKEAAIELNVLKSTLSIFISYQLSNCLVSNSGIGCGYYDESGVENAEIENERSAGNIRHQMNRYFFDSCFSSEVENGLVYFVDFLLIRFSHDSIEKFKKPSIKEYLLFFEREALTDFWINNRDRIMALELEPEKVLYNGNFSITYEEGFQALCDELDSLK